MDMILEKEYPSAFREKLGLLAAMLGDTITAERMVTELLERQPGYGWCNNASEIAAKLPNAKRLMQKFKDKRYILATLNIAAQIGDKETAYRIMEKLVEIRNEKLHSHHIIMKGIP